MDVRMTSPMQAYHFILDSIKRADTYFAFKCVDYNLEHFKSCFPEMRAMRSELIDARHDKWAEIFTKPNIQIKNPDS